MQGLGEDFCSCRSEEPVQVQGEVWRVRAPANQPGNLGKRERKFVLGWVCEVQRGGSKSPPGMLQEGIADPTTSTG